MSAAIPITVNDEVQLNVWPVSEPQALYREVGAAHHRVFASTIMHVDELPMEQAGSTDRPNLNCAANPLRTGPSGGSLIRRSR